MIDNSTRTNEHNFWERTLGEKWKFRLPTGLISVILLSLMPSFIYWSDIEINKPKLAEEWFKNVLSLSVIFLIINYLNYKINISRSKDKITMYIELTHKFINSFLLNIKEKDYEDKLSNLKIIEKFLIKIQNEEEFIYIINHFKDFDDFSNIIQRLVNISNSDNESEIKEFEKLLKEILNKLSTYHDYIQES